MADSLELSAETSAAALVDSSTKKIQKLVVSDQVMCLLAHIILTNLSSWHLVLAPPGKHGEGRFVDKLVDLSTHAITKSFEEGKLQMKQLQSGSRMESNSLLLSKRAETKSTLKDEVQRIQLQLILMSQLGVI